MAFTVSHITDTVMGNQRVRQLRVTADAATQNVNTGLGVVMWAGVTPCLTTVATTLSAGVAAGWRVYPNSGAGGTALRGYLGVSNAVSGDVMDIIVFGKDL